MNSIKIGSSDGPTSVFVLKKNAKLTLKQKIQKMKYELKKAQVENRQMRASFLIRYMPELLGEYATLPKLEGTDEEKIRDFMEKSKQRIQKAMEIPVLEFDIDFHKFTKDFGDAKGEMHIIIEKKYVYIGGGASGSKKLLRKFNWVNKDIFRYYGVNQEDVESKSERYEDVVRALSR